MRREASADSGRRSGSDRGNVARPPRPFRWEGCWTSAVHATHVAARGKTCRGSCRVVVRGPTQARGHALDHRWTVTTNRRRRRARQRSAVVPQSRSWFAAESEATDVLRHRPPAEFLLGVTGAQRHRAAGGRGRVNLWAVTLAGGYLFVCGCRRTVALARWWLNKVSCRSWRRPPPAKSEAASGTHPGRPWHCSRPLYASPVGS